MPFGCAVQYKPSAAREVANLEKFGARAAHGIFVGYHLHSGGKWSGDYLVIDVSAYRDHDEGYNVPVHRVKESIPPSETVFPIKTAR